MNEWIPVSERLPGHNRDVLVCNNASGCRTAGHYRGKGAVLGEWGIQARYDFGEVTHWMPLPAPPTDRCTEGEEFEK